MRSMSIYNQETIAAICLILSLSIKVILDPCLASSIIDIPLFSALKPVYVWVNYSMRNEHTYEVFRGFQYWSFPWSCFPLKITVGFRRDPCAQMIEIRVAVSWFSFRSASCCCISQGPICWVFWVHLLRKQQHSSIANISSGWILYFSIVSWSNVYQWLMVVSFTAPPCSY